MLVTRMCGSITYAFFLSSPLLRLEVQNTMQYLWFIHMQVCINSMYLNQKNYQVYEVSGTNSRLQLRATFSELPVLSRNTH